MTAKQANQQTVKNVEDYMSTPPEQRQSLQNFYTPKGQLQRSILKTGDCIYRRINAYVDPTTGEAGPVLMYPVWQFRQLDGTFTNIFSDKESTRLDEIFKSLS